MGGGCFDEIAQHVVVLDLEALHAGLADEIGLHSGDHAATLVAQPAGLVEFLVMARRDIAAVAGQKRRLGHERLVQQVDQRVMADQRGCGLAQNRARILGHQGGNRRALAQTGADGGQIARAAAIKCDARQGAVHIGRARQRVAQIGGQARGLGEEGDGRLTGMDFAQIARGCADAAVQQTRARRGGGAVDGGQKRALAPARKRLRQFEVAPRGRVDLHRAARGLAHRRAQKRQVPALGHVEIIGNRAHRCQLGTAEAAEAVQRFHPEQRREAAHGGGAVETARRKLGQGRTGILGQLVELAALDRQQLARGVAGKFGSKADQRHRRDAESARRNIDPSQRGLVAHGRETGKKVVAARLEQRILGQRPRCDKAHDVAGDDRFRAALLGLGGVLHLLGDGDTETLADQGQQIAFGGMDGHAAHRDRLALIGAAFGQRDIERGRGRQRILEEHLVEIAHAVKQKRAGVRLADGEELGNHRSGLIGHRTA